MDKSVKLVRFGDLLDGGTRSGVYKPKEFHGSGCKIVNMGELFAHSRLCAVPMKRVALTSEEMDRFSVRAGDLLFARRSLVAEGAGKCILVKEVDEPTVFESSIIRVRPKRDLADSMFLYYLFSSTVGAHLLDTIRRDAVVAGITGTDLVELLIPVPDLPEQRAIAQLLGNLDDKIELNRRMNETLEAIPRALFNSWFVDFDPVRAKAEGRQPIGMDAETAKLFPSEFEQSELGEIPKGWTVRALDSIVQLEKGLSYKGEGLGRGVPMINLGCFLGHGRFSAEKMKLYGGEHRQRHLVGAGELMIANTDMTQNRVTLGSPGIVPMSDPSVRNEFLFSHHIFAVRRLPTTGPDWIEYLFQLFLDSRFRERASGFASGTTVLALPRDAVLEHRFASPRQNIIEAFHRIVSPMRHLAWINATKNVKLSEVRDNLLPRLVSGDLAPAAGERTAESTG